MLEVRPATRNDMADLLDLGRAFHAVSPYKEIPYSEASTAKTMAFLMDNHFLAVVGTPAVAMLGGVLVPAFFNHDELLAQEMYWWSEKSGAGGPLLEEFEKWGKENGASRTVMISLSALDGERVSQLLQHKGYVPAENYHIKVL